MQDPVTQHGIGRPPSLHHCPRHAIALVKTHAGNLSVWRCADCADLWMPAGAFHARVGHVSIIGRGRPSGLACPADGHVLTAVSHRGIEVDVCGQCGGVWFDHGELQKILEKGADPARRFLDGGSGSGVADVAGNAVDLLSVADLAGDAVSAVFEFLGGLVP